MVSIAMKPNPFKEKIAGVKLSEADSGEELSTLNKLSSYPTGVALNCSIDFFNIQPETNYTLIPSMLRTSIYQSQAFQPLIMKGTGKRPGILPLI